jgi:hypothetical protein
VPIPTGINVSKANLYGVLQAAGIPGIGVSKANLYGVLQAAGIPGIGVSKANLYGVLEAGGISAGVAISKANMYAVLGISPPPVNPLINVQIVFRGIKRSAADGTASKPLQEIQQAPHVKTAV